MPPKGSKRQAISQAVSPSTPSPIHDPPARNLAMEAAIAEMNATMNAKLDMLCATINKINEIETSIRHLVTENATLKADLASRDVKIQQLTDHVNRLDQASRSTSLRILGLPVTTQSTTAEIIKSVYNEILLPILTSAKAAGDIDDILPAHFIIVNAFAIPTKVPTVILKLQSEVIRSLVFKFKKSSLPTCTDLTSNRVRNKYSIFEDLAPSTHAVFRTFSEDARVKSVWSFGGQVRFKTHESETVYKLKSLSDTFEATVKPSSSNSQAH
jgi:hypothetical protein